MAAQLQHLTKLVRDRGLSQGEFEARVLQLSNQERRMFERLLGGSVDTVSLRSDCSIGNPSEVRASINQKLEAVGDPRRVVCSLKPHRNRFNERGVLGTWSLVDTSKQPAAA